MWQIYAHKFYWVATALQRMSVAAKIHIDKMEVNKTALLSQERQADLLKQVETLDDEVAVLGCRLTYKSIGRFSAALKKGQISFQKFGLHPVPKTPS
jgi:hypothetical protein